MTYVCFFFNISLSYWRSEHWEARVETGRPVSILLQQSKPQGTQRATHPLTLLPPQLAPHAYFSVTTGPILRKTKSRLKPESESSE